MGATCVANALQGPAADVSPGGDRHDGRVLAKANVVELRRGAHLDAPELVAAPVANVDAEPAELARAPNTEFQPI